MQLRIKTTQPSIPRPNRPRRGVAMLLVIISLMTATILATAYLASRDNSALIGDNVAAAATARWGAITGLDVAVAVLETDTEWRTSHDDGVLIRNLAVGSATISVTVSDLITGDPPNQDTDYVHLTSTAVASGVVQTATASAYVNSAAASNEVSVDLAEFAIFTRDGMRMGNDAIVTRWPLARASSLRDRIAIGTRSTAAGAIELSDNAALIDSTIYYGPGASESLINNATGVALLEQPIEDLIPVPLPPNPPPGPLGFSMLNLLSPLMVFSDTKYLQLDAQGMNATLTVRDGVTVQVDGSSLFQNGAGTVVDGDVTLVFLDDLVLTNGSFIEVTPGSTLKLFVGGQLRVQDGYIGDLRADRSVRDASGYADYINPSQIEIYGVDNGDNTEWVIEKLSVVKGSVYSPYSAVRIKDDSAVYGRVATTSLRMENRSALFYDPSLNRHNGFTNLESRLYDEDGRLRSGVANLTSLSDSELASLAQNEDLLVYADDRQFGTEDSDTTAVAPQDPHPRPVPVSVSIDSHGIDMNSYE